LSGPQSPIIEAQQDLLKKTIADWQRWLDYRNGIEASRAGVHRSSKGVVDQARRLVVRAYRFQQWGLPGGDYKVAASSLTQAGYPTTEQDFKNAGRAKGRLTEHLIPADAHGRWHSCHRRALAVRCS
jgi:hypothetical protein